MKRILRFSVFAAGTTLSLACGPSDDSSEPGADGDGGAQADSGVGGSGSGGAGSGGSAGAGAGQSDGGSAGEVGSGGAAGDVAAGGTAPGGTGGSGIGGSGIGGSTGSLAPSYVSYMGGSLFEHIRGVASDKNGNVYFAGGSRSMNLPTTAGVVQPNHHPGPPSNSSTENLDVFVGKLDANGNLVWLTYLGGPNYDRAYAVAVDDAGFVYVAGRAGLGFPVTSGAFQTQFQGGLGGGSYGTQDGFVCKLTPSGASVVFCSYFGTPDDRIIRDITVDGAGNIFIASGRSSGNYPSAVASKFVNSPIGGHDAVFARIASNGSSLVWARYVGGSGSDLHQNSVRLDATGAPYGLFSTSSTNIPTSTGAYRKTNSGGGDVFVTKLDPANGTQLLGTYFGGAGNESTETHEIGVTPGGEPVIVAPTTTKTGFPTTPGVVQPSFGGGGNDIFVAKLSADFKTLAACTYLGGNQNDCPEGTAIGSDGTVYFTGVTHSPNFPTTANALQKQLLGAPDAVVVSLSSDLKTLRYSSYLGGSGSDVGRSAALTPNGSLFFAGESTSLNFPVQDPVQANYAGGTADGFFALFVAAP